MNRFILGVSFINCVLIIGEVFAGPPLVTFPTPDGTPGIQLPYNTSNGVNPFAGDVTVDYGKQLTGFGWQFDTFQGSSIPGADSLGRYAPTLMFDNVNSDDSPGPVVAMPENRDWVFHTELRYQGDYLSPGNGEFVLFAKHVPGDSGGTPDGREDRIFSLIRGGDADHWSIGVGNASGGWTTVISNLQHTMDDQATPPEQYVDFDVHYKAAQHAMDFYWESQLVGSASTGHGRYDLDYFQIEHKDSWGGIQDFRNFRLGAVSAASGSLAGDYDGNGTVDAADYIVWRKNLNAAGLPGSVAGDGDDGTGTGTTDGLVNQYDYTFWRSRFGATTPLGSASAINATAAVPEPATLLLWALVGLVLTPGLRVRR